LGEHQGVEDTDVIQEKVGFPCRWDFRNGISVATEMNGKYMGHQFTFSFRDEVTKTSYTLTIPYSIFEGESNTKAIFEEVPKDDINQ
jgi:hypothetical protein